jgi:hypothetical protein
LRREEGLIREGSRGGPIDSWRGKCGGRGGAGWMD